MNFIRLFRKDFQPARTHWSSVRLMAVCLLAVSLLPACSPTVPLPGTALTGLPTETPTMITSPLTASSASLTPTATFTHTPAPAPTRPSAPGRLVFVSDVEDYPAIYTINSDGRQLTKIFDDLYDISGGAWSPDGSQIAFSAISRQTGGYGIFIIRRDGSSLVDLPPASDAYEWFPAWSPDGTRLVYISVSNSSNDTGLDIVSVDGSQPVGIRNSNSSQSDPVWSPDGKQIAFTSEAEGRGIFIIKPDGTGLQRISSSDLSAMQPAWSPDGSQIAFSAMVDLNSNPDIYVMNADGTGITNLTSSSSSETDPTWSPDGSQIAFVAWDGAKNYGIYTVSASGGSPSLLLELQARIWNLDWGTAPDLIPTSSPPDPALPTSTPVPPSPDDGSKAQQALVAYFDDLHAGRYEQAAQLYGGGYACLFYFYPTGDPHDHASLFKHVCESLLLRCMQVKTIQLKSQTENEFEFTLEFKLDDGSLFLLGPCCGGTGDPISQFTYRVTRTREGKFLVMDLPVYVP